MNIRLELKWDYGTAATELKRELEEAQYIVYMTLKAQGAPVVVWNGQKFRGETRIRRRFLNGSQP